MNIIQWDGQVGTLNTTNQTNFSCIQKLIDKLNGIANSNPIFNTHNINFDLQIFTLMNRNMRVQFLNNAKQLNQVLPDIVDEYMFAIGNVDYEYQEPIIPDNLVFDKNEWNQYWQAVANDLGMVNDALQKLNIGG